MAADEVFPNPLVKKVIFQIRFPNLFFLKDLIGKFQIKIMKDFPKSELLLRRHFLRTTESDEQALQQMAGNLREEEPVTRIWQFTSVRDVKLEITSCSLALVSESHKSYRLGTDYRFRDVIELVTNHFFEVTEIPIINRIGLRYIDECPVFENSSEEFRKCYNTVFPLDRFSIETAEAIDYKVIVVGDGHKLRYIESLQGKGNDRKLILDFDAWSEDIESDTTLDVADRLHDAIRREFQTTIKEPILEYMRKPSEDENGCR